MMRRRSYTLVALTVLLSVLAGCGATNLQSATVARVGNTNITEAQFTQNLEQQAEGINNFLAQGGSAVAVRQQVFDGMVRQELLLNEARRTGVGVDADTSAQIDQVFARNVPSGATFANYQAFAESVNFASVADVREFLGKQLTLDKFAQQLQLEGAPQQFNVRHILISATPTEGDAVVTAAKQQADSIVQRLRNGEDFAALASEFSADTGSKDLGGDLQWIDPAQMVPEFGQAVQTLPLNQIGDPVQTQFGWHIIEVLGTRTFANWQEMQQSPAGQAYIEQKVADYTANGQLQYFIDPATVPFPALIKQP